MEWRKMMNDDSFARIVAEDVKNKISPLHKKELLNKENWDRWQTALVALSENIQDQIESIEEDAEIDKTRYESMGPAGRRLAAEAKSAYAARLMKIRRFKFHVDRRLDEVTVMIETGKEMVVSDGWQEVDFLKRGISAHRSLLREFDLEDTAVDRALWALLENKWLFDDVGIDTL